MDRVGVVAEKGEHVRKINTRKAGNLLWSTTCVRHASELLAAEVDNDGSSHDSNLQQMGWKAARPQMERAALVGRE